MITTQEELNQAMSNQQDGIEIEGDLAKKVIKIKATGKVAWIVAFGAICVAMLAFWKFFEALGHAQINTLARNVPDTSYGMVWIYVALGAACVALIALILAFSNRYKNYKIHKISSTKIKLKK
ncbi:hypothetical protein [Helicobacter pametensis]|uniref:hypothetical protein n=1 Tax=Helicobacter pametensis TaxID=95149 RepID=UPI0004B28FF6|nr:hypothetical protein [Helicobacter pametensis]